jgi:hypothetical protein
LYGMGRVTRNFSRDMDSKIGIDNDGVSYMDSIARQIIHP